MEEIGDISVGRTQYLTSMFIDAFANQAYVNVDETESESRIFVRLEHYRSSKCIAYLHM